MENQSQQVVVTRNTKNVGVALILTFFFGPLGLFYATVSGALIVLAAELLLIIGIFFTDGATLLLLFFTYPICMIWSAIAVNKYNNKLLGIQ